MNVWARFRTFSLTTRLTTFFLAALLLVLAGCSTGLYFVAKETLSRQVDERLESAMHALMAAIEFNEGALEWEPFQRHLGLGTEPDADEVRWTVRDGAGTLVDRAKNVENPEFLGSFSRVDEPIRRLSRVEAGGRPWRVSIRRINSTRPTHRHHPHHHFASLILTAAVRLDPIDTTLRNLARIALGLSLAVWLVSAALGRTLCRRALRPLSTMADAARGMNVTEIAERLPSPSTGDELEELADAFNDLLDRLGEAFARQARFTGDASHQLRTPLAVMLGQIDVALRRDRPAEEYKRTLALVRDQAARLGQIVEMLLFLSRADAEAGLPGRAALDLETWAEELIARWSSHQRANDLELIFESEGPWSACVHPPLLGQLIDNLLDNACKYTDPGTRIRFTIGRDDDRVTIAVADDGPGIAPEELPHLFKPFYRSDQARRLGRPGVGLGLAVADRIATAFGGSLTAESARGEGSTFRLTLPA